MESSPGARRSPAAISRSAFAASLLVSLVAFVSSAAAATESGAGISGGGGAAAPATPQADDVICTSGCVGLRKATVGGTVQVSGRNLSEVTKMTFAAAGKRLVAPISEASDHTAEAAVPAGAIDGRVRVKDDFGNSSGLSPTRIEIHPRSELGSAGALALIEAEATPRKAYFFGVHAPRLNYIIGSSERLNDLRIDVIDADGGVTKSFFVDDVEANTTQTIRWTGKTSSGKSAPSGRYSFRISSQSGERVTRAREVTSLGFKLYGYRFPVRGPHQYWDGIGAPRAGHTHQGQDVGAACGTLLEAARGGRVQYAGYQSAAGNYIVIDGKATGLDFVYMHLRTPALFNEGQLVHTGAKIGEVGETGDATGCHLHFEVWSAPGWYEGGHFLDPLPYLKRWDAYS
jgi:murein DD-endopeptidase MepM/ murein hydrolase activator NlpD